MAVVGIHALTALQPISQLYGRTLAVTAGQQIDSATKRLAAKFYVATTSPIEAIDFNFTETGNIDSMVWAAEIQADSSDAPSGTALGAATAGFSVTASGQAGSQALGSNTGALSLNTPYWLVIYYVSGGPPDAGNHLNLRQSGVAREINDSKIRHFNGTDWTTVAAAAAHPAINLTHVDGSMTGLPILGGIFTHSGTTDIFGTNRQGISWKSGAQETIIGARFSVTKTGAPAALELVCYEGSTQKASAELAAAEIITNTQWVIILFGTPPTLAGDATRYLILRQAADGGSDANDYDLRGPMVSAGLLAALLPPDTRHVHGTGDDPTALTVATDFVPQMIPLYGDPATALDSAGGGSTGGYTY